MKRTQAMVMVSALIVCVLSLLVPSATAQTGYPPGPCAVLGGSQFAGNVTVGQTFTVTVAPTCLWTPGATANVIVNGSTPFTKTVNADGTVTLTVTILSTTQASINPIVPVACGINTIQVTAPSAVAGDRPVTQTVTFNLICPGVPIVNICNAGDGGDGGAGVGQGGSAVSSGGTATGGTGTGTGGAAGDGGDACNVTLVSGPSSGGGGGAGGAGGGGGAGGAGGAGGPGGKGGVAKQSLLARTGGALLSEYALAAAALVITGILLTVAARRRRSVN